MSDKKPLPPLLVDDQRRSQVRRSRKHEQRLADRLGGRRIRQSGGALWSRHDRTKTDRGDVSTPDFHVEHKYTDKKSIGLKLEWLEKVQSGAQQVAKDPMLIVTFDQRGGRESADYAIIPMAVLERLLRACGALER